MSKESLNMDIVRGFNIMDSEVNAYMINHLEKDIEKNKNVWANDGYAMMTLGIFYYEKKEFNKTILYLEKAIKIDPSLLRAYVILSRAYKITIQDRKLFDKKWNNFQLLHDVNINAQIFEFPVYSKDDRTTVMVAFGVYYRNQAEEAYKNKENIKNISHYYKQAIDFFSMALELDKTLWQVYLMQFHCVLQSDIEPTNDMKDGISNFLIYSNNEELFNTNEEKKRKYALLQKLMVHSSGFRKKLLKIFEGKNNQEKNINLSS